MEEMISNVIEIKDFIKSIPADVGLASLYK